MVIPRIIPILLLSNRDFVKTKCFSKPEYVGDPINILRIFNEKEVDELVILDIDASKQNKGPDFEYLELLAGECFMPLCYGGGVSTREHAERLFSMGIEKVSLNHHILDNIGLIKELASEFGNQSIVGSVDVKKTLFGGYAVYDSVSRKSLKKDPIQYCRQLAESGVGEILISLVDRESTGVGYDLKFLKAITESVNVPVIANGGAGTYDDFRHAFTVGGVAAVSAGSLFIYYGKHRAVLISYPGSLDVKKIFE